jgi:uncharacterized phage protein (TIGR01671 family)
MTPEFRAWDKQDKKLRPVAVMNFSQWWLDTGELTPDTDSMFEASDRHNFEDNSDRCNRFVLEQYTGLKDKNGNKIFEGDIVRVCYVDDFDGENSHNQFVTSVEFNAPMFGLNQHHIPQEWALHISLSALFDSFEDDDYEFEVIDNIHENPELLEAESEQTN